jgi:radical SAM protein with 4Fe4S-binding SPASM domain
VRFIDISLHGPDDETHEAVSQIPGSYQKTLKTIKLLKAAGIHYNLKANMLKPNYKTANKLHRCMLSLGGMPMLTPHTTPDNQGGTKPNEFEVGESGLCFLIDQYYSTDFLDKENESYEEKLPFAMRCTAGFSNLAIAPNGEVFPCLQARISLGNIKRKSLRRIWHHSPVYLYLRELLSLQAPDCVGCDIARLCVRCPGLAYIEKGSLWKASPTACRYAKKLQTAVDHLTSRKGVADEKKIHSS